MTALARLGYRFSTMLFVVALAVFTPGSAGAEPKSGRGYAQVILSQLPAQGTPAYDALKSAAAATGGQILDMTHSEMWTVPRARLSVLLEKAGKSGVSIIQLDKSWNHMMRPMEEGHAMSPKEKDMMTDSMAQKSAMGVSMMGLPDPKVMEFALTKGMSGGRDTEPGSKLVLPLTSDLTVTAERVSVEKTQDGYVWQGTIPETGESVTLLWWPNGRLTGSVSYKGHVYAVKNMSGTMHGVVDMAPNRLPPEHARMDGAANQKMNKRDDPLYSKGDASMMKGQPDGAGTVPASTIPSPKELRNQEDRKSAPRKLRAVQMALTLPKEKPGSQPKLPVTITVLVAYTKKAASHYEDITKDLIALAIQQTNQSFRNSGVGDVRIELAHAYETPYAESGSHFDQVFAFAEKNDGILEEVHSLRDQYKADVSLLIVDDDKGCGLAAKVAGGEDRAFAVVHYECAATNYSFAHEIGHIIGARHDLALDETAEPFPFGHGFVSGKNWRTMMSYEESCDGCPRLLIWSNPEIKVGKTPAGDATANNARVIAEQAARVAGFR
jgi:hypothetical protein